MPGDFSSFPFAWTFIDEGFDPGSRVRRGRLFQKFGDNGWEMAQVKAHPAINSNLLKAANNSGRVGKELSLFIECTDLLQKPNRGEGFRLPLAEKKAIRCGASFKPNESRQAMYWSCFEQSQRSG